MNLALCTKTHHDVIDLVNHGLKIQKLEYLENET